MSGMQRPILAARLTQSANAVLVPTPFDEREPRAYRDRDGRLLPPNSLDLVKVGLVQGALAAARRPGFNGRTPFHEAALLGRDDFIRPLLELDRSLVKLRTNRQTTPLMKASLSGMASTAKILLAHGASVWDANDRGRLPLHLASTGDVARWLLSTVDDAGERMGGSVQRK